MFEEILLVCDLVVFRIVSLALIVANISRSNVHIILTRSINLHNCKIIKAYILNALLKFFVGHLIQVKG